MKQQFLDVESIHLNSAGNVCMQRSFLCEQSANHVQKLATQLGLQTKQVALVVYALEYLPANVILIPR